MPKNSYNLEDINLCETCQNVVFLTKPSEDKNEIRCYKCPFAECHSYKIKDCPHYNNPNVFQRFLRSKLVITFTSLILLTIIIGTIIILA